MASQESQWEALGEEVDILIIGGGINGAGVARDAARRGLKVALVEMRDLAYGTSSRSSKLVHGGLRYLENLEFSLVFESVSERKILLNIAPHLVNPLGFIFPVFKSSRVNLTTLTAGMWLYDGLSLFRSPKRHRKLKKGELQKEEPSMTMENLKGAQLYYDCSTNDARLTLENAIDAQKHGAVISTWTSAVSFLKNEDGRIKGAVVKNMFTGDLKEIKAHTIINAAGPWTDKIISMSREVNSPTLRPTKGIHIVVNHEKLPVNNAVVCVHPDDERVLFAIPWGDQTYIGTTDTDFKGDPSSVRASKEDVDYLIDAAAHYFPKFKLQVDDVICTWAGLRPLIAPPENVSESEISREHKITVDADGLISVAGGKLTTYRKMSSELVDTAVSLLSLSGQLPDNLVGAKTAFHPLPGAVNWPPDDDHERVAKEVQLAAGDDLLDMDVCRNLANTYGMLAIKIAQFVHKYPELGKRIIEGRPEIYAQIDWGVQREFAATVTDILIQRTQIFYRDRDQGLNCVEAVAKHMGKMLEWSDQEIEDNISRYRQDVSISRKWRDE